MRTFSILLVLLSAISAAFAQKGSPHFEKVRQHIDVGGQALTYVDVAGDPAKIGSFIDDALALAAEAGGGPKMKFSTPRLIELIGAGNILAAGSSTKISSERKLKKSYMHFNGKPDGLLKMIGGASSVYRAASLAPAGTDLILEQEIDLRSSRKLIGAILAEIDVPDATAGWQQMESEQAPPPLGMSLGEVLDKVHTRAVLLGRLNPEKRLNLPQAPVELPDFDLFIQLEDIAWLVTKLTEGAPEEMIQKGPDGWRMALPPMPPEAPVMEPVLHFDPKTGHLSIATDETFLKECLSASGGLFADASFQTETAQLPKAGNHYSYISPRFGEEFTKIYMQAMEASGDLSQNSSAAMAKIMKNASAMMAGSIASATTVLPDGILTVTNSPKDQASISGLASVTVVAIAASVAVPVFGSIRDKAKQNKEMQIARGAYTALVAFSADHDGSFPGSLDQPRFSENFGNWEVVVDGRRQKLWYVAGLTDQIQGRLLLLASPASTRGKRAVCFVDGSCMIVSEAEFQQHLRRALEQPGTRLVK